MKRRTFARLLTLGAGSLGLLQGEAFLAVTRLSPPPAMQGGVVLGADVKQKKTEAQAFVKLLEHDLSRNYPNEVRPPSVSGWNGGLSLRRSPVPP